MDWLDQRGVKVICCCEEGDATEEAPPIVPEGELHVAPQLSARQATPRRSGPAVWCVSVEPVVQTYANRQQSARRLGVQTGCPGGLPVMLPIQNTAIPQRSSNYFSHHESRNREVCPPLELFY